jgi:uncharacterized protein (DUF302 family)
MKQSLAFHVRISDSFANALELVEAALQQQGFGVLTRIDVQATLKEKLDVDFHPYVILGACNPPLAHRALSNEPRIGVMLPCNVTLEQQERDVLVSIANPETMLATGGLEQNAVLCDVAAEARLKLMKVREALAG